MDFSHLDGSTAFILGQDYAYHGMSLPEDIDTNFQQGYEVGRNAPRGKEPADRFVRKWLQVRANAWRRNRAFDASTVTPDFLRKIDRPTCLVSGVTLTHGTGHDTDWSIDRLDNNGAYTAWNLMVLSTRVNKIKGSLTLRQLYERADAERDADGLTAREWLRLARIASCTDSRTEVKASEFQKWNMREVLLWDEIPRHLPCGMYFMLQHWLILVPSLKDAKQTAFWQLLHTKTEPDLQPALQQLRKLAETYSRKTYIKHRQACHLFADDATWALFRNWFIWTLPNLMHEDFEGILPVRHMAKSILTPNDMRLRKQEETAGYR